MKAPGNIPLFSDTDSYGGTLIDKGFRTFSPTGVAESAAASLNHGQSGNIGYVDGHVACVRQGDLKADGWTHLVVGGTLKTPIP